MIALIDVTFPDHTRRQLQPLGTISRRVRPQLAGDAAGGTDSSETAAKGEDGADRSNCICAFAVVVGVNVHVT